ncbi:uncharacterized protein LOC113347539 [Papaver somniferum]|uniref:uncharacterized protein LOC113347539 n=1 Tax=Papaver somniferum TaxID=3469 RepID=UPI000E70317E|nr:uncharacterized protein LOC113347539 [Papaver somniferum]
MAQAKLEQAKAELQIMRDRIKEKNIQAEGSCIKEKNIQVEGSGTADGTKATIEEATHTMQCRNNIVVEETNKLEWGAAKDEEDRLKKEQAAKKKAELLAGKKAPKKTSKNKKQQAKAVQEDDKGPANPSDNLIT